MKNWPNQNDLAALHALYGNPDANNDGAPDSNWVYHYLTTIKPPYAMFYDGKPVRLITVNRGCADALLAALTGIGKHYGTAEALAKVGLDQFSGCYNFRKKRAGKSLSMHALACAIDMDAAHNPFQGHVRHMPDAAVAIFEDQGAEWGGRWSPASYDPMHFQFARTR